MQKGSTLNLIFNDHVKNTDVLQIGQKPKKTFKFGRSNCYNVSLNTVTGKYTRTTIFNNKENPTAMPRLGSVLGNNFYFIGKDDKLFGKTKIAVAKLSF